MKKLRNLVVSLLLVVCAFSLVACGEGQLDTKAEVDKSGNYTAVGTATDVNTVKGDIYDSTNDAALLQLNAKGYKVNSVSFVDFGLVSMKTNVTFIFQETGTENDKFAMKLEVTSNDGTSEEKVSMYIYMNDGKYYFNGNNGKTDIKFQTEVNSVASILYKEFTDVVTDTLNIGELVEQFLGVIEADASIATEDAALSMSKAVVGQETRIKIESKAGKELRYAGLTTGSLSAFLSYETENKNLIAFQLNTGAATSNTSGYMDVTVARFNDNIDFPKDMADYPVQ